MKIIQAAYVKAAEVICDMSVQDKESRLYEVWREMIRDLMSTMGAKGETLDRFINMPRVDLIEFYSTSTAISYKKFRDLVRQGEAMLVSCILSPDIHKD